MFCTQNASCYFNQLVNAGYGGWVRKRPIYHIQWICSNYNIPDFILGSNLTSNRLNCHFLKTSIPDQEFKNASSTVHQPLGMMGIVIQGGHIIVGYLLLSINQTWIETQDRRLCQVGGFSLLITGYPLLLQNVQKFIRKHYSKRCQ